MLEFKAGNTGAEVVINPASYKEVLNLKKHILIEIKKHPLGLKLSDSGENILNKEIDISDVADFLKDTIIALDISDELNNAIFSCLKVCSWNMHKITPELFDIKPEIREDYYEIVIKCIEENLRPFMKSLASEWKILAPKIGESPLLPQTLAMMSR